MYTKNKLDNFENNLYDTLLADKTCRLSKVKKTVVKKNCSKL